MALPKSVLLTVQVNPAVAKQLEATGIKASVWDAQRDAQNKLKHLKEALERGNDYFEEGFNDKTGNSRGTTSDPVWPEAPKEKGLPHLCLWWVSGDLRKLGYVLKDVNLKQKPGVVTWALNIGFSPVNDASDDRPPLELTPEQVELINGRLMATYEFCRGFHNHNGTLAFHFSHIEKTAPADARDVRLDWVTAEVVLEPHE